MGFKTILVQIEQHDLMNPTLQTALLLARKFDSYIEGLALRVEIPAVFAVTDVGALCRYRHWNRTSRKMRNEAAAFSRTSCKSMACRTDVTQRPSQAVGWTMPLRVTTL